jgi:hypothetical protein
MNQIEKLIKIATAEIGTRETTWGSNNVKYNTWYYGREVSGPNYSWCAAFVAWCFNAAGLSAIWLSGNVKETAYCPYIVNQAKMKSQWHTSGYQRGDIALFDWDGDKVADHVGIVETVISNGTSTILNTIEGNTSDQVMRHSRTLATILGVYRPKYEAEMEDDILTQDAFNAMLNAVDPIYNTFDDVPVYWQNEIGQLTKEGYIKGDGVNPIAMRRSTLQSVIIAYRMVNGL